MCTQARGTWFDADKRLGLEVSAEMGLGFVATYLLTDLLLLG